MLVQVSYTFKANTVCFVFALSRLRIVRLRCNGDCRAEARVR